MASFMLHWQESEPLISQRQLKIYSNPESLDSRLRGNDEKPNIHLP